MSAVYLVILRPFKKDQGQLFLSEKSKRSFTGSERHGRGEERRGLKNVHFK